MSLCGDCKIPYKALNSKGEKYSLYLRFPSTLTAHQHSSHAFLVRHESTVLSADSQVCGLTTENLPFFISRSPFPFSFKSVSPLSFHSLFPSHEASTSLLIIVILLTCLHFAPSLLVRHKETQRESYSFVSYSIWTNGLSYPQPPNWCHTASGDWEISKHYGGRH